MKTKLLAAILVAAFLIGGTAVYAATTTTSTSSSSTTCATPQTSTSTQTAHTWTPNSKHAPFAFQSSVQLTVGCKITFSNLEGVAITSPTANLPNRVNASGSFTFTVTGVYQWGYSLTITSGTVTIGSTTYTVSGGNLVLNGRAMSGTGQGTMSSGPTFLVRVSGLGINSTGSVSGHVAFDITSGTSQWLVNFSLGGQQTHPINWFWRFRGPHWGL
jgi:plastocyanin